MNAPIDIKLNVTPSQKEAIVLRMRENGFDEIGAYLKVVALKTVPFTIKSPEPSSQDSSVELGFSVTAEQKTQIEENMKKSGCEELETYLKHVSLYGVVSSLVEIRSSGNLEAMLRRIAESKNS